MKKTKQTKFLLVFILFFVFGDKKAYAGAPPDAKRATPICTVEQSTKFNIPIEYDWCMSECQKARSLWEAESNPTSKENRKRYVDYTCNAPKQAPTKLNPTPNPTVVPEETEPSPDAQGNLEQVDQEKETVAKPSPEAQKTTFFAKIGSFFSNIFTSIKNIFR